MSPLVQKVLAVLLLVSATVGLAAQEESLDDLFDDPAADTLVVETETDHLASYVTAEAIKFNGSFKATGGVAAGWTSWPRLEDPARYFDGTIGLTATASLSFDARPDPDFRLYGNVSTSMNPLSGSNGWSGFALGELFVDYTWLDNVFIRMGQQSMSWGQGRLFEAVTNVMSDAASGFSFRASLPTLLDGVQAVALINRGAVASWQELCYAARADKLFWGTLVSAGVRYQRDEGLKALVSVKKTVFGVDLFGDLVVYRHDASGYEQILAGFFKEWKDVKLYGEYYYNGATWPAGPAETRAPFDGFLAAGSDHTLGLACGFNNVFGTPVDAGFKLIHTFFDGSGLAMAGLTWKPWKMISATLALPVAYGADGSRYVGPSNPDAARRRLALVFGLELSASF